MLSVAGRLDLTVPPFEHSPHMVLGDLTVPPFEHSPHMVLGEISRAFDERLAPSPWEMLS